MKLIRLTESMSKDLVKKVFKFHVNGIKNQLLTVGSDNVPVDPYNGYYDEFSTDGTPTPLGMTARYEVILKYRKGISGADVEVIQRVLDSRGRIIDNNGMGKGHIKNVRPSLNNSYQICEKIIEILNDQFTKVRVSNNIAYVDRSIGRSIVDSLQQELPTK